jgi:hypothetical protein
MPRNTTYDFTSISNTISHPLQGQNQVTGEGIGSVTVTMTDDRTKMDVAADGAVMISKIHSGIGSVAYEIQQTSALNQWLINVYNAVDILDPSYWAQFNISINELYSNGIKITASGAAFQKLPDHKNAQNGDNVTWTFLCANITEVPI